MDRQCSRAAIVGMCAVIVTSFLAGCDPVARTTIHVSALPGLEESSERVSVSTRETGTVVKIVSEVAERHGLECSAKPDPSILVRCFRGWDRNEDGHARSIQVSASTDRKPDLVEVVVMEWLTFRHTPFGRDVLDELTARLQKAFGSDAVFRVST